MRYHMQSHPLGGRCEAQTSRRTHCKFRAWGYLAGPERGRFHRVCKVHWEHSPKWGWWT